MVNDNELRAATAVIIAIFARKVRVDNKRQGMIGLGAFIGRVTDP